MTLSIEITKEKGEAGYIRIKADNHILMQMRWRDLMWISTLSSHPFQLPEISPESSRDSQCWKALYQSAVATGAHPIDAEEYADGLINT